MSERKFEELEQVADDLDADIKNLVGDLKGMESSYDIAYHIIDTMRSYVASGRKTVGIIKMVQGLRSVTSGIGKFFGKGD